MDFVAMIYYKVLVIRFLRVSDACVNIWWLVKYHGSRIFLVSNGR